MYNDEERKYSIIGKVEIGTDEYRDLIEGLSKAKSNESEERSKRWTAENKVSERDKLIKTLTQERDSYLDFINSTELRREEYKTFRLEQMLKKENEANE